MNKFNSTRAVPGGRLVGACSVLLAALLAGCSTVPTPFTAEDQKEIAAADRKAAAANVEPLTGQLTLADAIARGNKYLVTFPNRLNTDRYVYTEELDQFAYTSADVIGEGSEVAVTVYGEGTPRVYRALKANGPLNTGMRLLMLVEGGGVPVAP